MDLSNQTLFWFRRDLRLKDNHGLYRALAENQSVVPVFIFDKTILNQLPANDARVTFIHQSVNKLKTQLEQEGSTLFIFHGNPLEIFRELRPSKIYTNHDYEPYARDRDNAIKDLIRETGGNFYSFKDQVIFEKDEITKDNNSPYVVFTPYMKRWKSQLTKDDLKAFPVEDLPGNLVQTSPVVMPELKDLGFVSSDLQFPSSTVDLDIVKKYHETRNFPGINGTSKLSVHLRFGTISIRELVRLAINTNETYLNELIWREFYMMILWNFPHVVKGAFKPAYNLINWENNEEQFDKWCSGKTGFPIVDAGMRELNATGYMHNRLRMITSSFLCKTLLIDWRWGEAYFAEKLLDFELSSNNGGWQWASGSGCDAAPYFRIFNPNLQAKKFDPELQYIKRWVPEYNTDQYPDEIIDYPASRERVLRVYKSALEQEPYLQKL